MIPPLIVRQALARGLNLIAVTDHNAAANCAAVMQAAQDTGLAVLPGMEVQTVEEVHTLCLFDTIEQALTWQGIVFDHLPDLANAEDVFGAQYVVDAEGEYIRTETRLLQTATDLPLEEVLRRVKALGRPRHPSARRSPLLQPARQSRFCAAGAGCAGARNLPSDRSRRGPGPLAGFGPLSPHSQR